ncbi:hypothetical protein [Sphingobium nicotianae]|uniref:Uncharacterized protein n=1 Tax=Sphingobium nicotianae TaxID=2782607 RepID=A0A9X1IRU3_9SPHN|nr:hypothetical protein [Sphingobium nicotianae]MBT2187722.1 hypothetical protein [Sphingobium nicotianae]
MSDVDRDERLVRARQRATVARLRFINSVQSTRRRLSPARLKEDALLAAGDYIEEVRHDARQTIRRHPIIAVSAVAGLFAMLFWRPARVTGMYGLRAAQILWLNRRLWRQSDE